MGMKAKGTLEKPSHSADDAVVSQERSGFMGRKQLGFGDYDQSTAKKRTKRENFMAEMEVVVSGQLSSI